jgi:3-oxoacyl-[acyl-carrier-protein] synthase I
MIPVAITGMGAVSAAGPDVKAFEAGLKRGERVFGPNTRHPIGFEVTVAEARADWFADHDHSELDSPTGRLCLRAARECDQSAVSNGAGPLDGLVLGTSTGGQSLNEEMLFSLAEGRDLPSFNYRGQGCMAAPTRLVARDLDICGPVQTISTACTSSAGAIALGATWIAGRRCKRVLAGGGDALCYTTISGFHILDLTGPDICRPFGSDRPGLTLGDGAGFLMLESWEEVQQAGRTPLAVLIGYGMSSDAHHMTAPPADGAGAEAAIRAAIEGAGIQPSDVSHVNAHGTGTTLNDAAEAQALSRVFQRQVPVMSCKGLVGHTLGGAGGIEAVASVLSVNRRRAFENIGASSPGEDCTVSLVGTGGIELPEDSVVLSNSFAFGGNNCALLFKSPPGGAR